MEPNCRFQPYPYPEPKPRFQALLPESNRQVWELYESCKGTDQPRLTVVSKGYEKFKLPERASICSPNAPQYEPIERTPISRGSTVETEGTVMVKFVWAEL